MTLGLSTIVLVLIALPDLRAQSWQLGWDAWLAVIYAGALTIALGYVLWTIAMRRIGATQTAVLTNLNPVVAADRRVVSAGRASHGGSGVAGRRASSQASR